MPLSRGCDEIANPGFDPPGLRQAISRGGAALPRQRTGMRDGTGRESRACALIGDHLCDRFRDRAHIGRDEQPALVSEHRVRHAANPGCDAGQPCGAGFEIDEAEAFDATR